MLCYVIYEMHVLTLKSFSVLTTLRLSTRFERGSSISVYKPKGRLLVDNGH